MNKKGLLLVVSGPSGVGKGTLMKLLLEKNPNLRLSVSATTRSPRPGEVDGESYFFLTRPQFDALIAEDGFLEYAIYGDNCYGTPKKMVEDARAVGQDVILEIEAQGAMQIREKCPDAVLIFILPPSYEELKNRLIGRHTEPTEVVERRLATAKRELLRAGEYDYAVVNDQLETAAEQLLAVIEAAKCTANEMKEFIDEVNRHA